MELKPGYKQSEVGVIPEEWETSTIRSIASSARNAIVGGPFGSNLVSRDYVEQGVPVIRGQNMSGQWISGNFVYVTSAKAKSLETNLAHPGDIVFTQRGTLGQVSLVPAKPFESYLVSQSQMKLSMNRKVAEPLFFFYLFTSEKQQELIRGGTIQTGVPHINLGILRDIAVQLPPLPEQRAIATMLSDVDELIGALDQLIAKKRDLKQATMQQLLTGQTRLSGFSSEWTVKRLDELGAWKGGMTPSMQNPGYWLNGNVPWISSADVKSVLLAETAFSVTSLAVKQGTTTLVPANSIVVVTRSGILRKYLPVAMNVIPMAINQDIKALIPTKELCSTYLLHALIWNGDRIRSRCLKAGTTVESIEFRWLKAFIIRLPPRQEQTAIAQVLTDMDAELAALERRRDKTRALKQGMMQELLTGRIRLPLPEAQKKA